MSQLEQLSKLFGLREVRENHWETIVAGGFLSARIGGERTLLSWTSPSGEVHSESYEDQEVALRVLRAVLVLGDLAGRWIARTWETELQPAEEVKGSNECEYNERGSED